MLYVQIIDKIFKLFKKILQPFHKHIRIIVTRYGIDNNNLLFFNRNIFLQSLNKKIKKNLIKKF